MVEEEGKKGAAILEKRRGPPLAKKSGWEAEKLRSYFEMPDGTLVFDQMKLAETTEGYRHYARR